MAERSEPPSVRGDEAELFERYQERLLASVVRSDADLATAQDACAMTWVQLLRLQPARDQTLWPWLVRTAAWAAWHQQQIGRDDVVLSDLEGVADQRDLAQERVDLDEALSVLSALPPRLRRSRLRAA